MSFSNAHMDEMAGLVGSELGVSAWFTVQQSDIDTFAKATYDPDPLHIDPNWARDVGPFGSTVAFGFQTLSMLTHLAHDIGRPRGSKFQLNYGLDKVRFMSPVPVGSRIRLRMDLKEVRPHKSGLLLVSGCTMEIEGTEKPALTAEWLGLLVRDGEGPG